MDRKGPLSPLSIRVQLSALQRLLPVASGPRTHAVWQQAVVGPWLQAGKLSHGGLASEC